MDGVWYHHHTDGSEDRYGCETLEPESIQWSRRRPSRRGRDKVAMGSQGNSFAQTLAPWSYAMKLLPCILQV